MNLDALFQQIQLTEKQAREKRRFIQQAKFDINRSYEKINQIKEELSTARMKLETKVQHLSEKQFYLEILKKREDSLEKQKAELINQNSSLLKIFTDAKRKMTEEEDNFTREVTEFNNEYGLTSNRDLLIKKKVKTEINDLENEAALLKNELREEVERLRSIREAEKEIDWWCHALPPLRQEQEQQQPPVPLYNRYEALEVEGQSMEDGDDSPSTPDVSPRSEERTSRINTTSARKRRWVIVVGDSLLRGTKGPLWAATQEGTEAPNLSTHGSVAGVITTDLGFFDNGMAYTAPGYTGAQPKSNRVELGDTEAIGAKRKMPVKRLKAHKGCCSMKETQMTAQLKCLYTNARSMGNKQEELEAIVHQEDYDMVALTKTW
ncbi:hypothetical protein QYF61_027463 [Mycteria americana]|uniref:Coiled-coil domain-containing protein 172 n=1 Tax=Mycteria americana TaxID=33587 RepID=A0AAN7N851_MYCAM|nr:hypothetical protein QYF61_027463 [Mycteria americana]